MSPHSHHNQHTVYVAFNFLSSLLSLRRKICFGKHHILCFGSILFFSDKFQTRRHINTWTREESKQTAKKKNEKNTKNSKNRKNWRKKNNFLRKIALISEIRVDLTWLSWLVHPNWFALRQIMLCNMKEEKKMLRNCSMFNPIDLVQQTNGKTGKKKMNEIFLLEFRFAQFQPFEYCLKSYFIASIT